MTVDRCIMTANMEICPDTVSCLAIYEVSSTYGVSCSDLVKYPRLWASRATRITSLRRTSASESRRT